MHSIGIEHEGFAADGRRPGTPSRCTRTPSALVTYLAQKYGIPLDRAHIIGHDQVPGIVPAHGRRHALGPGPVLGLGALLRAARRADQADRRGNERPGDAWCPASPTTCSRSPAASTAAVDHPVRGPGHQLRLPAHRPDRGVTARHRHRPAPERRPVDDGRLRHRRTGRRRARSSWSPERQGDWTAVWCLGQQAWIYNPAADPVLRAVARPGRPTATGAPRCRSTAAPTPSRRRTRPGSRTRRSPRCSTPSSRARPTCWPTRRSRPTTTARRPTTARCSRDCIQVRGGQGPYYQIWFGHRIAYVRAADVVITNGLAAAAP